MADVKSNSETAIYGLPIGRPPSSTHGRDELEVLASEFTQALRQGRLPSVDAFACSHPEYAGEIRELFPMLAAMEGWKEYREKLSFEHRTLERLPNGQFGTFRIVREIGRGGMGIIFEAIDQSSGRRLAIKVLPFLTSRVLRERFELEAKTASALRHRHIVPVYGCGEHDGLCYYAMRLIRGVGLDWVIECLCGTRGAVYSQDIANRFDPPASFASEAVESCAIAGGTSREGVRVNETATSPRSPAELPAANALLSRHSWPDIARIAIQVAEALHHAHIHGILHRDIKPANLLLDTKGDIWVTDFGLAHDIEELLNDERLTPAGTLRYIAPEQFTGKVDVRSDIYSIGITLFELVTRTAAFRGSDRRSWIESITNASVPDPRDLNSKIPRDLAAIVTKAAAKNPASRYASAAELLADLVRFCRGERVRARRAFGWLRFQRP